MLASLVFPVTPSDKPSVNSSVSKPVINPAAIKRFDLQVNRLG